MVATPRTVQVEPGSELDEALATIDERPVELERAGVRYRLRRVAETAEDLLAGYDPERAIQGMRSAAGSWSDIDAEQLKRDIYRWRDEGSDPRTANDPTDSR